MLVRDTMTGYLHEVPDHALYGGGFAEYPEQVGEGQVVFDGLGNPVGFLPFLPALANALPAVTGLIGKLAPAVSNIASQVVPAVGKLASQLPGMLSNILPGGGLPGAAAAALPALPFPPLPIPGGAPGFPRPPMPMPLGWQHATLPYTGLAPRRVYMRCAVWPGPAGLVPTHAAAMPAVTAVAAQASPVVAAGPAMRHHRRHRR